MWRSLRSSRWWLRAMRDIEAVFSGSMIRPRRTGRRWPKRRLIRMRFTKSDRRRQGGKLEGESNFRYRREAARGPAAQRNGAAGGHVAFGLGRVRLFADAARGGCADSIELAGRSGTVVG